MDFLNLELDTKDINAVSNLGLAHIGDAVYELMVRTHLIVSGAVSASKMHKFAIKLVSAPAQARAAEKIMPFLNEEEITVYKRGRNTHVNSVPQASTDAEYHSATGIEALFGYLYLKGRRERLNELFKIILED